MAINHHEVGKHFVSFNGQSYVACDMLKELYPDDQPSRGSNIEISPIRIQEP